VLSERQRLHERTECYDQQKLMRAGTQPVQVAADPRMAAEKNEQPVGMHRHLPNPALEADSATRVALVWKLLPAIRHTRAVKTDSNL